MDIKITREPTEEERDLANEVIQELAQAAKGNTSAVIISSQRAGAFLTWSLHTRTRQAATIQELGKALTNIAGLKKAAEYSPVSSTEDTLEEVPDVPQ